MRVFDWTRTYRSGVNLQQQESYVLKNQLKYNNFVVQNILFNSQYTNNFIAT